MKKKAIALICLLLCCTLASGCATKVSAADLTADIQPAAVEEAPLSDEFLLNEMALALKLFQGAVAETPEENTLLSPLSIQLALAMTANGAVGQTLQEMETLLGGEIEDLNSLLYTLVKSLPSQENAKLHIANSIWFRDDPTLSVKPEFLQTDTDYYAAQIYKAPFNDSTVADVNRWVKTHTDGMIDQVLSKIPEDAMLYLVNALAFDAKWQSVYNKNDLFDGAFTNLAGQNKAVQMMASDDERLFLDDGRATGFLKSYEGDAYRFAALLPNEGVDIYDYIAGLTPEGLQQTLKNPIPCGKVYTNMPKFTCAYSLTMNDLLKDLGIPTAFGQDADFSRMGSCEAGGLYISNVLHKTYLSVDELGTRAGAVTVVEMAGEGMPCDICYVNLDRPFVYLIVDSATNLPLFIGVLTDI